MTPRIEAAIKLHPAIIGDVIGRPLDGWQAEVVSTALVDRQDCCLRVGRQSGKTESAAQLACALLTVPALINKSNALVILTSPSQRQSSEIHRRVLDILDALSADFEERNRLSLKLKNGSRFLALPGSSDTLRGISAVDLLLLDEAAFVDHQLISAIRPMLAVSGGRMVMLSTPADPTGFFSSSLNRHGRTLASVAHPNISVPACECSVLGTRTSTARCGVVSPRVWR